MELQAHLDSANWNAALAECPACCRDAYLTPEYHHLYAANGDGDAFCTVAREGNSILLVPGMQVPIPAAPGETPCWDLQTCNGYGGPVGTMPVESEFIERAWTAWREDCRMRKIVAAFFRLHPLLRNEQFLPRDARIVPDRQTVYVDLSQGLEMAWNHAKTQYRNMISKGRREGVEVAWNEPAAWEELEAFYSRSMDRLNAAPSLRFSPPFFGALRGLPARRIGRRLEL